MACDFVNPRDKSTFLRLLHTGFFWCYCSFDLEMLFLPRMSRRCCSIRLKSQISL